MHRLMAMLTEDMRLLIDWDKAERNQPTKKDSAGCLWLHRAILAHRIKRTRLSERSLRNVVEQGASFYAWNMLLDIYGHSQSCIGVLRTITEVVEFMDH
jgi:hypothetical protein